MYSIHFHIRMLDNKSMPSTVAPLPAPVDSLHYAAAASSSFYTQHPPLISPIDHHDASAQTAIPAAH
ncbi:hypothetical protein [Paenibacillus roseipurpureus]|uniref:Uncharacterized protein n=1 Tax=Paenibacillus roseopurpureus TaxID=2918901 RepID=A0AA96RJR0_9BACL|nr:hypothetical protein [Paenibacillus sp. MBLB1832]WNR45663.1 hypothetical protein MJB10_06060 [Paenibacillus sp. MBLB1832]